VEYPGVAQVAPGQEFGDQPEQFAAGEISAEHQIQPAI
jgi:hypothetical protein